MPDRLLGTPKRAAYLILLLAVMLVVEGIWIVNLSGRVSNGEAIRRAEDRTAVARKASECRARIAGTKQANDLLSALRDLAHIPQTNLQTYLDGTLTDDQRANYTDALARYKSAEKRFHAFPLPTCVRTDS